MRNKHILGICGSPKTNLASSSEFLLKEALHAAEEEGAETRLIRLVDYNILPCTGCGNCMANQHCHLLKRPEDQLTALFHECLWADAFIFSSPVYALSLPSIWKNWIDRCEPCSEEDIAYPYYCYDTVCDVKGKAFKGKVAAQICVAAGPGHEWALASLLPAFTAVKLSVVASVGLSLIEYDGQPGIQSQSWAKDISEAKFAIEISRSIGKRIYETIGYSTFHAQKISSNHFQNIKNDLIFFDSNNNEISITETNSRFSVLVFSNKDSASNALSWLEYLNDKYHYCCDLISIINIAQIEQLPHFISKTDIIEIVLKNAKNFRTLFDWNLEVTQKLNLENSDTPTIFIIDCKNRKIIHNQPLLFIDKNISIIEQVIESLI